MKRIAKALPLAAAALSGLLLALCFPPFAQADAVWFAFVPLLLAVRAAQPRRAFLLGWISGAVFWLVDLAWLWELRHNGGPVVLVGLGHIALSAWCALFTAIFARAAAWLWGRPALANSPWRRLALVLFAEPLLWVGAEWLRGTLFTGFPWNPVAASQYRNPAILHCASWAGAGAVSLLVVLVNGGIASLLQRLWHDMAGRRTVRGGQTVGGQAPRTPRDADGTLRHFRIRTAELTLALALTAFCLVRGVDAVRDGVWRERGAPRLRVALVHPELPCIFEKDDGSPAAAAETLLFHTSLAAEASPDVCLWPETSLPGSLPYDEDTALLAAKGVRALGGAPLVAGGVEVEYPEELAGKTPSYRIYNDAFQFGQGAAVRGLYRKRHLVPFGEYIPFERRIPALGRLAPAGFSCTPGDSVALFRVSLSTNQPPAASLGAEKVSLSPLICFEDVFPYLAREAALSGADVFASLANDAWFDGSAEAEQHLDQAVLRCVENGRPMVRSTNSGVTALISADGRVLRRLGSGDGTGEAGFLVHDIPVATTRTPYTRFGDRLLHIPAFLVLLVVFSFSLLPKKSS